MANNDVIYPISGNKDLAAAGLPEEDDDDIGVDLLGTGGAGPAATATGMPVASNTTGTDDTLTSSLNKRKSGVWVDFDEIYKVVNGNKIQTQAICKMCRATLSARSATGTAHLIRHQKSCRKKTDHAARVQSRLAFNSDGSLHNWIYDPVVARSELCRLIARLDLPLSIGERS
jgi:hypothetical protein